MSSSASEFGHDHGLVHEAVVTGRKAGWNQEDWAKLAHDVDFMRQIRAVRLGLANIHPIERVVDLDADPLVPEGLKVVGHLRGGQWKFNKDELKALLSGRWWGLERFVGVEIEKAGTPRVVSAPRSTFNANLLDFFIANQYLVPDELKEKTVYFWDTLYSNSGGGVCVRAMFWNCGRCLSSVTYVSTARPDDLAAMTKKES